MSIHGAESSTAEKGVQEESAGESKSLSLGRLCIFSPYLPDMSTGPIPDKTGQKPTKDPRFLPFSALSPP
jgi:hypothetical protein